MTATMTGRDARLVAVGYSEASDVELLAAILGGSEVKAQRTLQELGGILGVQRASLQRLMKIAGLGPAGAAAIRAAFELGRRASLLGAPYQREIRSADDVAEFLRAAIGSAPQESFMVLGLDARNRLSLVRTVAIGSLARVDVSPREVFRPLVEGGIASAILVHNHPSGDPEPSEGDIAVTQRMAEVGRMLGIPVFDHIVVTRTSAVSMAELGLMPPM